MKKKLKKFIKNNNLQFTGNGSDLNSDCCTISGYALYIGASMKDIKKVLQTKSAKKELIKVFPYANSNNYGQMWSTKQYKKMYKY